MGITDLKLKRMNTFSRLSEKTMMLDFVVMEENSLYQIIHGRLFMRVSQCVMSTHYMALKYRVNGVVGVVNDDQRMIKSCYDTAAKETLLVTTLDSRRDSRKGR